MLQPRTALTLLLVLALVKSAQSGSELEQWPARRMQQLQEQQADNVTMQHPCPVKVSVVMLNWQRPQNVRKIARTYATYQCIDEIIIWMCHPDTRRV